MNSSRPSSGEYSTQGESLTSQHKQKESLLATISTMVFCIPTNNETLQYHFSKQNHYSVQSKYLKIIFCRVCNRVDPPEGTNVPPISVICKLRDTSLPGRDVHVPTNVGGNKFRHFLSPPVLSSLHSQKDISKEIVSKSHGF